MPVYEYECSPCLVVYQVLQGMKDGPLQTCPRCSGSVRRVMSAASLNLRNHSSPTEAKYARMSHTEEMAREKVLQRNYETVWLPPQVKHDPWDHDH